MREFDTGATRDDDNEKLDYEGFLSPVALKRYAEYMHEHRKQVDGGMRASDNWQKGIPLDVYMKSLWRHLIELWNVHRDPRKLGMHEIVMSDIIYIKKEALCAIIFNAFGYLHEITKGQGPADLETQPENRGPCHPKTQLQILSTHGDKE